VNFWLESQHGYLELNWQAFKNAAPQIADVGEQLLRNPNAGEVAIIATVDEQNRPWLAPFCPIFTDTSLYLLAAANTPKTRQLAKNAAYSLHAMVGADDLEFQVAGVARRVDVKDERAVVLAAVPFPSFDPADPIFELTISRALTVTWPEVGKKKKLVWAEKLLVKG